jgi:PhoH-like ATPase
MRKNFILDTNVLLYDPRSLEQFGDNNVIVPIEVVEELDGFKRDASELGRNSRTVTMMLDDLSRSGKLGEGVALASGGLLRIMAGVPEDFLSAHGLDVSAKVGNRILNLAVYLNTEETAELAILVTKNTNLRLKADALGIYAEDYVSPRSVEPTAAHGFHELTVPERVITDFAEYGVLDLPTEFELVPNEYLLLTQEDGDATAMVRIGRDAKPRALTVPEAGVCSIRARNVQQAFALDALLDDDIKLVTLVGRAGTGKTLLAVAAGLHKVIAESVYNRMIISRPTMPMGRDIGFIPGDIEEKMRPWMQPVHDAVEMIREQDRRAHRRTLPNDLLESDDIGIEPLTYIRGRSIPHQFFVIDEAQNLTPHEVKTIITRVGYGTKIVLTGDPEQIDNPYGDLRSNGLTYLLNRFRNQRIAAHISLLRGERSELAEIAANVL